MGETTHVCQSHRATGVEPRNFLEDRRVIGYFAWPVVEDDGIHRDDELSGEWI